MSKKYFVVADIHGFFDKMIEALNKAGFDKDNPEHYFISLGDLLDRGKQPEECLKYVLSLDPNRTILIRGNHEDLMEEAINRGFFLSHDYSNGTSLTAALLTNKIQVEKVGDSYNVLGQCRMEDIDDAVKEMKDCKIFFEYLNRTIDFYETEKAVFVHGWIPSGINWENNRINIIPEWRTSDKWSQSRWDNGMKLWNEGCKLPDKTIFCGHYHTSYGHSVLNNDGEEFDEGARFDPFIADGIVALDGCTAYSGIVNCYVLED